MHLVEEGERVPAARLAEFAKYVIMPAESSVSVSASETNENSHTC